MTTILFEALAPPVPVPPATGDATLSLFGAAFAQSINELGAIGLAEFDLEHLLGGVPPGPIGFGIGDASFAIGTYGYGAGVETPGSADGAIVVVGRGSQFAEVGDAELEIVGLAFALRQPPTDGDDVRRLTARAGLAITRRARLTVRLQASLELLGRYRQSWRGAAELRAVVALEERLTLILHGLLLAELELGATVQATQIARAQMVDALLIAGVAMGDLEARQLVADAVAFGDVLQSIHAGRLAAGLTLSGAVRAALTARAHLVDELLAGASAVGRVTMLAVLRDRVEFEAGAIEQLELRAVLRDSLQLMFRLQLEDGEYVAWVMNTESRSLAKYTNYPFNSFMRVGGKYYGATDTGIYLLEGENDDGDAIRGKLRAGLSSMGSRLLKRFPYVYFGYTATGDVLLKVVVANAEDAVREAHVYRLAARAAGDMREGRVPVGRGLKNVYWDWVIENVDGAQLAIDTVEFLPMQLERRVRGNSSGKR